MTIEEFVQREASLPPYPGACCRMVDRWLVERCGFSALARFGRDFDTDDDVARWLAEPGGIAVAVNRVMRAAGFKKTKEPLAGDVGLVFRGPLLCMSIHAGKQWVSRDESGLVGLPLAHVWKAWSLMHAGRD